MIDSIQIKAARAMLDWSRKDLAIATDLAAETITKIENGLGEARKDTLDKIQSAFERNKIEFTEQSGVRIRSDDLVVISGDDPYLKLLDTMFEEMKDSGDEVLFFFVDNKKSIQAVIDSDLRMRRNGIGMKFIINENNPFCLFPVHEYRGVPAEDFINNTIAIFKDRIAIMIDGNEKCFVIRNSSVANTFRRIFYFYWKKGAEIEKSTSPTTYE